MEELDKKFAIVRKALITDTETVVLLSVFHDLLEEFRHYLESNKSKRRLRKIKDTARIGKPTC